MSKKQNQNIHEVAKGAFITLCLRVVGSVFSFIFSLLLARIIGAEGTGQFALIFAVTSIATVFGRIGLDNTLIRFTAANIALNNWEAVKGVYQKGILIGIIASTISALLMYFFSPWMAESIFHDSSLEISLKIMAVAVVPTSLSMLYAALLNGIRKMLAYGILQGQQGVGLSVLLIIGLLTLGSNLGVPGIALSYAISSIVLLIFSILVWRFSTPQIKKEKASFNTQLLIRTSLPLMGVSSLNLVNSWSATIILGASHSSQAVGIFSTASRISLLIGMILLSANSILSPKLSELYALGLSKEIETVMRKTTAAMTIIALPILIIIFLFSKEIMGFFGKEFIPGNLALIILSLGQLFNVVSGSTGPLLIMTGNEKTARNLMFASTTVNLFLSLFLVKFFSYNGAAIASSVSFIFGNILALRAVLKKLSIKIIPI
jgi:O-antigen/teichoic acid export membrane protein